MGINLQPPLPRTLVRNVSSMSTHIIHYVPFRSSLGSVLFCFILFCLCAGLICCCRRRRLHMRLRFLANVPFYHFCRPSYRYHYRATQRGAREGGTTLTSGQTNLLTMMNAKFVRVAYFTPCPSHSAISRCSSVSSSCCLARLCTGSAAISRLCAMRYAYATLALVQIYDLSVARSIFTRQQQQQEQRKWLSKLKHAPRLGSASAPA